MKSPKTAAHALTAYYKNAVRAVDKKYRLSTAASINPRPTSTGLLVADFVMGGGMYPLFTQISGMEASGKTTLSMFAVASAIRSKVPIVSYFDAEGAMVPEFSDNILGTFKLTDVFSSGRAGYYNTTVLEEFTGYVSTLLKSMPDKTYIEDASAWCYSIPKGQKTSTPILEALSSSGMKPDRKLSTGSDWLIPTEYDGLEGAIFLDSWPSLIPDKIEEDNGGAGLGATARVMSAELPKFAGKLKRKGVLLWSINQLRTKPMQAYGDPSYEPGGAALGYVSAIRNRMYSRAVPQGFTRDPKSGGVCLEPSAYGSGTDVYAFKQIVNTKSKVGRPFLKGMARVWISDRDGKPRGFDPAFDVLHYLQLTGQIAGTSKGYTLKLRPEGGKPSAGLLALSKVPVSFTDLKGLVVAEHFRDKQLLGAVLKRLKLTDQPHLRAWLFAQMQNDKGLWSTTSTVDALDD